MILIVIQAVPLLRALFRILKTFIGKKENLFLFLQLLYQICDVSISLNPDYEFIEKLYFYLKE